MSIESVTQAVSNLALEFGDDDAREGAMVRKVTFFRFPLSNYNKCGHCMMLSASTKFIEFLLEIEARGYLKTKVKGIKILFIGYLS